MFKIVDTFNGATFSRHRTEINARQSLERMEMRWKSCGGLTTVATAIAGIGDT